MKTPRKMVEDALAAVAEMALVGQGVPNEDLAVKVKIVMSFADQLGPVKLLFDAADEAEKRAPGVGAPAYTHADVATAHAEGYKQGLAQKDRP